jgi:hypothetical protein
MAGFGRHCRLCPSTCSTSCSCNAKTFFNRPARCLRVGNNIWSSSCKNCSNRTDQGNFHLETKTVARLKRLYKFSRLLLGQLNKWHLAPTQIQIPAEDSSRCCFLRRCFFLLSKAALLRRQPLSGNKLNKALQRRMLY